MATVRRRRRRYDAAGRQARARANRWAIVQAAERLFRRSGFAGATMAAIAADAGVSVETIFKVFGNKTGLVRAIREQALAGEGPIPAERRSDQLQARERDPRAIIRGWGVLAAEVAPKVTPILLLVREAAATDAEMAGLQKEMDAARLTRMVHNARTLHAADHLRPGVTLEEAADVLWIYSSPELYDLLVLRRGWTPERYGRFIVDGMVAALLSPQRSRHPARAAAPKRGHRISDRAR